MGLIGRDAELRAVQGAIEHVRGGSGRVLGVLGEAGIGKSAVLAAIAADARSGGFLVLEGRGAEDEREVPFGVVVDALDDHVAAMHPRRVEAIGPELGVVLPAVAAQADGPRAPELGAGERFRYHRALRSLLEQLARERPVALLLDDLHWADEASLELVLHLLRRPPRAAQLLAFALRPVGPVARLLEAARDCPGWAPLALAPLDHDASLRLLTALPDTALRERVAAEAGGNPLFLRELAHAADDPGGALPRTLVAAVALEVAALAAPARALLEGAAVAGDPFDPELAAIAAGRDAGTAVLDDIVAADLIRPTGRGRQFAFRHPLVRRAVYDQAPPAWRLDAHERVAGALERRGASATARAHHVACAGRPGDDAAIALLTDAAAAAAGVSPATAAHWYGEALRLVPDTDSAHRASLMAPMALALGNAGRLEASRNALVEVLALLPAGAQRVELVTVCAQLETELGRHAGARARLLTALGDAPPDQRSGLAFELAATAFYEGHLGELREWSVPAVRAAAGDPPMLAGAQALDALGALWTGDPEAVTASLDRATDGFAVLADTALAAQPAVAVYVGVAQLLCERFPAAIATSGRALAISRRTGQAQVLVPLLMVRAMAQINLLGLEAALTDAHTGEEIARLEGVPRLLHFALWIRALAQHHLGQAVEAERAAEECGRLVGELEPSKLSRSGTATLAALRAEHDPERAIREIVAGVGPQLEDADPTWASWLRLRLTRAAIAVGRPADGERWAQQAEADAVRLRLPAGGVRARCARAELLLAQGDAAAAATLAQRAAADADRIPALADAADARLLAGRAHAAAGDAERARSGLQQLATDAGRSGALALRDAAARELRRLGSRVSAEARRAAPGPLTPREHEIAELVSEGCSNKQIALRLHLSEKTVEAALTRAYAKLGVRTRTQLTREIIGT
jgi:DNA-binding NarL/FixJ family response regulator